MEITAVDQTTKNAEHPKPLSKQEKDLREAVERVYRRYGTNLAAFFRDAHREAQELEKRSR